MVQRHPLENSGAKAAGMPQINWCAVRREAQARSGAGKRRRPRTLFTLIEPIDRLRVARFTLVELLVVIAILAILMAILLPSLGRAKISAHSAGCASNLRQIFLAITLYASDNRNYAVPIKVSPGNVWWSHPNGDFVLDYLTNENVLRCPSAGPPFEWEGNTWTHPRNAYPSPNRFSNADRDNGAFYDYALTYEYSSVNQSPWDTWYYPPAPLHLHHGDVNPRLPGRLVGTPASESHLVYDNRNAGPASFEGSDSYAGGQEMKAPRHRDGLTANVGYVDDHVAGFKSLKFSGWPATIPR